MPAQDRSLPQDLAREEKLARTFVDLTDTLVETFDVHDFLHLLCVRTEQILTVQAVGVLIESEDGTLGLVAASSQEAGAIDLFELQARQGPCYEAYMGGAQILTEDLETARGRWPGFVPRALEAGFGAVAAFPLRLHGARLGAMNLFRTQRESFEGPDVSAAQALADMATIGLISHRRLAAAEARADQLQYALESRVIIEQAKGMVAHHHGVDPEEAFELLRYHARPRNLEVRAVAERLVTGELDAEELG